MKLNNLIDFTVDIVAAHAANNSVSAGELPTLIMKVHDSLKAAGDAKLTKQDAAAVPKISARASIKPDYLICMECGAKHIILRPHLRVAHSMTPSQYRERFGLADDYPMSSPNYSAKRRDMARATGLGRRTKAVPRKRLSISSGQAKKQS